METWKQLKNYPNYLVSDLGNIKSVARRGRPERVLRHSIARGYHYISLSRGDRSSVDKKAVHRLVAQTFIPNPNNLPEVNHIDGNKHNNAVTNLEWCTRLENITHAYNTGLKQPSNTKRIAQYTVDNKLITTYCSINEAARTLNINRVMISNVVRGIKHKTHGFIFKEVV